MNKQEVSRVPPAPPFLGFKRYDRNQNITKTDKEEVPRAHPPPPAPPFLGFKRYDQSQNGKKKETEEVPRTRPPPPAPPFLGYKRYTNQNGKRMHKEDVPQTPPAHLTPRASSTSPPPPPRRAHRWYELKRYYQNNKKMKKAEVPLPPPPPPPAPPFLGFKRYHKQENNITEKEKVLPPPPPPPPAPPFLGNSSEEIHQPPPPPPAHLNSSSRLVLKRYADKSSRREVPRPPPRPPHYNQNPIEKPICLLSHPTLLHNLSRRPGGNAKFKCFACGEQKSFIKDCLFHHHCTICEVEFHHGCHKFPRKITHPYHPQHPLTFTFRNFETGIISDGIIDESFCNTVLSPSYMSEANTSEPEKSESVETIRSQTDIVFPKCTWCGRYIEGRWFYRCSTCNFCLDLSCSKNIPLLTVPNPKSHHHSLIFYPRPLVIPCDACGLINSLDPSYACFQCNYVVHQSCVDLPRVIKITRHQHRLSYTPYLTEVSLCRVCYKTIDNKYGQFSCNHEDCSYVIHSKCATHENIWDKKELEWEPEECNEAEDIAPFKKVGSDMIKHFSHEHLLKLEKFDGVRDAEKQCQACILPINSRDFYNCSQCDYFLHEVCAGLLRKLDHALHVHPLVLDPSPQTRYIRNGCKVCSRKFTGFRYKCSVENCELLNKAQIDVCCILVPDYFIHKAHEHPLFVCTSYKGKSKICCEGCKTVCAHSYLQCSVCKFAMCYQCATIPTEVSYKHDKHPLSLCYGERVPDGIYWCEVCEKKVNPKDWFYTCNKCCITIHLQCVFGPSAYMKHGSILDRHFTKMEVFRNSKSTRPFCTKCKQRCPSSVYYKIGWLGMRNFCSLNCLATKDKLTLLPS